MQRLQSLTLCLASACRFKQVGVPNSLSNRAAWRQALLTTPGLEHTISGVILTEETFYQTLTQPQPGSDAAQQHPPSNLANSNSDSKSGSNSASDGAAPRLVEALINKGVLVGVKVDKGTVPLQPGEPDGPLFETQTQGLDGLAQRCRQYAADGATFTKWRAVFRTDQARGWPSAAAVAANAQQLAAYAAASQAAGLVPIVEPEVLVMEGAHDIRVSEAVSLRVLSAVVHALLNHSGVLLEGVVLKPAMVLPGADNSSSSSGTSRAADVAAATLRVLRRTVPPAVPGIAFLSGGQGEQQAAQHLAAITRACMYPQGGEGAVCGRALVPSGSCACPWALTFSFGRALQASSLEAWAGRLADGAAAAEAAQQAFSRVAAAAAAGAAGGGGVGAGGGDSPALLAEAAAV